MPALWAKPQSSLSHTLTVVPAAPARPLAPKKRLVVPVTPVGSNLQSAGIDIVTKRPQLMVDPQGNIKTKGKSKPNSELAKQKPMRLRRQLTARGKLWVR